MIEYIVVLWVLSAGTWLSAEESKPMSRAACMSAVQTAAQQANWRDDWALECLEQTRV